MNLKSFDRLEVIQVFFMYGRKAQQAVKPREIVTILYGEGEKKQI